MTTYYKLIVIFLVVISFPPLVGHTTLVTLCGFAYGMNGFYIASSASIVGSAVVFLVLRFFLSRRLRQWSTQNEKWQALESVVVSVIPSNSPCFTLPIPSILSLESEGFAFDHLD